MAKPTIAQRAAERICPNCGNQVVRTSVHGRFPTFCSKDCKRDLERRQMVEGRAVIALLKGWRIDRGSGPIASEAFAQVCRTLDHFNAEDHKAGRPRADLHAAKIINDGTTYQDRMRAFR